MGATNPDALAELGVESLDELAELGSLDEEELEDVGSLEGVGSQSGPGGRGPGGGSSGGSGERGPGRGGPRGDGPPRGPKSDDEWPFPNPCLPPPGSDELLSWLQCEEGEEDL